MKPPELEPDSPEAASPETDFFLMSLDHLCVSGFDGRFVRVNPAWARTLGWTVEELMATRSIELVHPDDRAATLAGRARLHEGGVLGPLVNRYACKDGSYRWFEWRSIAVLDRRMVYGAARDITDQRLLEESLRLSRAAEEQLHKQLLFADRMASVGTLAAGAAHEINSPLACVTGTLALMIDALDGLRSTMPAQPLAELARMATEARQAAETIQKVIHGLDTFSRAPDGQRAIVDLREVMEVAAGLTAHEIARRARLVKDYGPMPLVEGDAAHLGQVFVSLLVNAVQAIPEGDRAAHEIRIVTSTEAGHAVIEVRDTGSGIPAGVIGRVFDPFFTTKEVGVGTGLGLSIAHNIVSALGGSITVTSEQRAGTVFRVAIPASRVPVATPAPAQVTRASTTSATVLVVDDDPAIGALLRRVLRGHTVTVVTGGIDALGKLEAGERYDVILSDLMMPGMSGVQLHHELLQRFPVDAARVIFLSGGVFTASARAYLDQIPNHRLEKPFDPRALRALVQGFAK